MTAENFQDLFPQVRNPDGTGVINDRCLYRTQEGQRVVMVSGIVIAQYAVTDRMAEAHAMVRLVDQGWADQNDVARAFGCSTRTLRRHQDRFAEDGLASLGHAGGYPRGRARLARSRRRAVEQLRFQGHSHREIARRMGVSEKAIRKLLRRLGGELVLAVQSELPLPTPEPADPNLSAFIEANPLSSHGDTDPTDRRNDRLLAYLGLLEDAAPLFGSRVGVPRAGVLLAVDWGSSPDGRLRPGRF